MIKFLTLRQFICPLSLFLKEIPFASLTNAIDVKIERVLTGFLDVKIERFLTGFLIGWKQCFSQSKSPLELSQFSRLWRLSRMQMGFLSKILFGYHTFFLTNLKKVLGKIMLQNTVDPMFLNPGSRGTG
jgi:hypothetical protein